LVGCDFPAISEGPAVNSRRFPRPAAQQTPREAGANASMVLILYHSKRNIQTNRADFFNFCADISLDEKESPISDW